ncbi:hypothetical protein ABLA30_11380 [Xenorhabdus nematophila]|uniref:hypothetical protein n=1 Tax=Xenorhabdus nematophila TaxID=628 RepID=UPI0032B81977
MLDKWSKPIDFIYFFCPNLRFWLTLPFQTEGLNTDQLGSLPSFEIAAVYLFNPLFCGVRKGCWGGLGIKRVKLKSLCISTSNKTKINTAYAVDTKLKQTIIALDIFINLIIVLLIPLQEMTK